MNCIDQGTILYGMRCKKYPENKCYAIIISARCDIANQKLLKLYYLTALNVKEWLCSETGFSEVYREFIKNKKNTFKTKYRNHPINFDLLFTWPLETASTVLNAYKKNRLLEDYFSLYKSIDSSNENNRRKIIKDNPKTAISFLKSITAGHTYHYFFLPKNAYENNEIKDDGLIVDLQEIGIMPLQDIKSIISPGIDYQTLSKQNQNEKIRLSNAYWLETNDDFVAIDSIIKSPWCELLMQRFANDFIRIGVDGSVDNDYKQLISQI